MEEDKIAVISVATEVKIINVTYASSWTAEDLCIKVRLLYCAFVVYKINIK
jgi:hypothetical protein